VILSSLQSRDIVVDIATKVQAGWNGHRNLAEANGSSALKVRTDFGTHPTYYSMSKEVLLDGKRPGVGS
jgi:hypothetical protein